MSQIDPAHNARGSIALHIKFSMSSGVPLEYHAIGHFLNGGYLSGYGTMCPLKRSNITGTVFVQILTDRQAEIFTCHLLQEPPSTFIQRFLLYLQQCWTSAEVKSVQNILRFLLYFFHRIKIRTIISAVDLIVHPLQ